MKYIRMAKQSNSQEVLFLFPNVKQHSSFKNDFLFEDLVKNKSLYLKDAGFVMLPNKKEVIQHSEISFYGYSYSLHLDSIEEPIANSINGSIFYLYKMKDNFERKNIFISNLLLEELKEFFENKESNFVKQIEFVSKIEIFYKDKSNDFDDFAILDFNLIDYKKSDGAIDILLKQIKRGNYFRLSSV